MKIHLTVQRTVTTAVEPAERVCRVAAMFGLELEGQRSWSVVRPLSLALEAGRLVFVTGASGSGKSSLMAEVAGALADDRRVRVIGLPDIDADEGQKPVVQALGRSLEQACDYLSRAGLNDAHVMLGKVGDLSEGQRYRYRLSKAMERADRVAGRRLVVVLVDEFASTLDRTTAAVIARQVRRWVKGRGRSSGRAGLCLLAATSHDDLLEPLEPDVLVVMEGSGRGRVLERGGDGP